MSRIISHYRLTELAGRGGTGQVWKAEDLTLNRTVAIKLLTEELTGDREAKERIQSEARMAAALNHPNIAAVYELGESEGDFYIAMEWIEGENLRSRIARGRLELKSSLEFAVQIANALEAAHGHNLFHCDVKSSNIVITPDQRAILLDFGLARISTAMELSRSRSVARQALVSFPSEDKRNASPRIEVRGTPGYMSPEQIRGEALDQRTDVFSLGVVFYEILTGNLPFGSQSPTQFAHAVLNEEPLPLSAFRDDVPLELEGIIRKALAKDREGRFATCQELGAAIRAVIAELEYDGPGTFLAGNASAASAVESTPPQSHNEFIARLRSRAWRHKRTLLFASIVSALIAALGILLPRFRGGGWLSVSALSFTAIACAVSYAFARRRMAPALSSLTRGAAFRGLLPFHEADRGLFYGRETEAAALFEMVRHSDFRFGVLFGESGCGKTSLLRAGLMPRLWEEGLVPILCRSYSDPMAAAVEECERRCNLSRADNEPAANYLARVAREVDGTLVIICDQFEEFFVNHKTEKDRDPFLSFLGACNADRELPVKFLAAMRSDFLYLISSELSGRISEPLISSRLYHLRNFDEAQAEEIIQRSALHAGLPLERGLSRDIARDLANEEIVTPSELQIVGEQIQRMRIYTRQAYKRAGGKEPLVHGFLEDVIQASGDADGTRLLLRSLISDENTRLTLTVEQICMRTQRGLNSVERLLRLFVEMRLIREIQEDEPWRYELMHEYLIDRINRITGRVMDATQRANRLLRQYLSNYSLDKRARVPVSKLWFIKRHSDLQLGEREREFLKRSARRGLLRSAAVVVLLSAVTVVAAAALSVTEEWDGIRLADGHTAAARKAVFSPDGRLLVTCGEDGRMIVWDFATRQRLATLADNGGWVNSVAFSPDGKCFAAAGAGNTIEVWDAARLEKTTVLHGHSSTVEVVSFSRDGRWLGSISGSPGGRTIIWDTRTWEKACELPPSMMWGDLNWSANGKQLLIGAEVWDLQTRKRIGELDPQAAFCAISWDQRFLAGIDPSGAVSFYETARMWSEGRATLISTQRVHHYHGRAVAISPDERLVASAAEDIVLWDAATQTKLVRMKYTAQVWSLAFSPDGQWLVSTHDDGAVLLWSVAERELAASFNGHSASIHSTAFSPDGSHLASASEDRSVIIWDVLNNKKEAILSGHTDRVTAVAYSRDGMSLASADMDSNIFIWDLAERKRKWATRYLHLGKHWQATYCVAFSPDERYLACTHGVYDLSISRQILDFGELAGSHQVPWGATYGVAFSPDGRRLACATDQGYLLLWDVETWQLIGYANRSVTALITLSFEPGGNRLITGDDEGAVRLWEVSPLREIALLGRHEARIKSIAISPDGREVASCGDDKMLSLWDIEDRRLISHIGIHTAPVLSVAFSADGKRLACGEQESVRVFTRHRRLWGYRLD